MILHVSNLGLHVTEESLNATFSTYGEVSSAIIMLDQFTGRSIGFALVEMPVETEANRALNKLDGAVVDGLQLVVKQGPVVKRLTGPVSVSRLA